MGPRRGKPLVVTLFCARRFTTAVGEGLQLSPSPASRSRAKSDDRMKKHRSKHVCKCIDRNQKASQKPLQALEARRLCSKPISATSNYNEACCHHAPQPGAQPPGRRVRGIAPASSEVCPLRVRSPSSAAPAHRGFCVWGSGEWRSYKCMQAGMLMFLSRTFQVLG